MRHIRIGLQIIVVHLSVVHSTFLTGGYASDCALIQIEAIFWLIISNGYLLHAGIPDVGRAEIADAGGLHHAAYGRGW